MQDAADKRELQLKASERLPVIKIASAALFSPFQAPLTRRAATRERHGRCFTTEIASNAYLPAERRLADMAER